MDVAGKEDTLETSGLHKFALLLVDDDEGFLRAALRRLKVGELRNALDVLHECDPLRALERIKEQDFDFIVTDLHMPVLGGKELLVRAKKMRPELDVIVVSGDDDLRSAVDCLKSGACDYFTKPLDFDELTLKIARLIESRRLKLELESLRAELRQQNAAPGWELRLPSLGMQAVRRLIDAIKDSDFPVLILGESGTGKEVIANAVHRSSTRAGGTIVKVNCAAIVQTLLESEMFGHEKGAFTGAVASKAGKFELASGGTLFLDEIGNLEVGLQAKLLRVLQDGEYERVGGTRKLKSDARIIAATNCDLAANIRSGTFREDLYYRLNVIKIEIPPLRERRDDILVLATRFLDSFSQRYGKRIEGFSREAISALEAYPFPGNVRELENAVARAFTMARGPEILSEDLPEELSRGEARLPGDRRADRVEVEAAAGTDSAGQWELEPFLASHEESHIRSLLAVTENNRSRAAERLGISRRQLYYKLRKYSID